MTDRHAVLLFLSRTNSGKSQMAAAIARQIGGAAVEVITAGTEPSSSLKPAWAESLREIGAVPEGLAPQLLTPEMSARATHIIRVGLDAPAPADAPEGVEIEVWDVEAADDPDPASLEAVRDDINDRVVALVLEVTGQPSEHAMHYQRIVEDVAHRYEGVFTVHEVRAAVRVEHAGLAATTKAPGNLPVTVERLAHKRLRKEAEAKGLPPEGLPEVLYICDDGGRSQLAAAITTRLSEGAINARPLVDGGEEGAQPEATEVIEERQLTEVHKEPESLEQEELRTATVVIDLVDPGDTETDHAGKRHERWEIPNPSGKSPEEARAIADQIEAHVRNLLAELL